MKTLLPIPSCTEVYQLAKTDASAAMGYDVQEGMPIVYKIRDKGSSLGGESYYGIEKGEVGVKGTPLL